MKKIAIIGHSGFIGRNLSKEIKTKYLYNSKNISEIKYKNFDTIYCCGTSSLMWKANKNPEADFFKIFELIKSISTVKCKLFILVSTIEVYENVLNCDEESLIFKKGLSYGSNRFFLENFITTKFNKYCIVRLPIVYGDELKKNIIYDLLNKNKINNINPSNFLQYYPVDKLYADINFSVKNNLSIVNLSSKPIKTSKIIRIFYKKNIINKKKTKAKRNYNMKTIHSRLWNKKNYLYNEKYIIEDLIKFRRNYFKK
jgi:hypothetical protein